jgi:GT2 family glycosyltransferase
VARLCAGESVLSLSEKSPFSVDAASGAAMLVRRGVFEDVGFIDEDFFLYFEEIDWCLAVRRAGYQILAVPNATVWHKISDTLGTSSPVIDYYMLRNHLRLISRHWSGALRYYLWSRLILRNLLAVVAFSFKPQGGKRNANRNARLFALRDAILGRWGQMGDDVARVCYPEPP